MPAIPQYQSQGNLPGGGVSFSQTVASGVGSGLQQAGKLVATYGQAKVDARVRREEEEQATTANAWAARTRLQWMDYLQSAQDESPADPSGFTGRISSEYQDYTRKVLAQPNLTDYQKKIMGDKAAGIGESIGAHALAFESSGRTTYRKTTVLDGLNTLANVAARDPTHYEDIFQQGTATIEQSGLSGQERLLLLQSWKNDATKAMLKGKIERDPATVIRELDAGTYDNRLNAEARAALYNGAQAGQKAKVAEAKAATASALSAVRMVSERMSQGFDLPPEEAAQIEQSVAGSADPALMTYWSRLKQNQSVVRQATRLSPVELDDLINSKIAPALNSGGATSGEYELYELLTKTADRQREALKKDPLSYAARVGMASLAPLDASSDEALSASLMKRAVEASRVSSRYGTAPVLLTTAEVAEMTARTDGQMPQEVLRISDAMRQMNPKLVQSFYKQIGEGDATLAYVAAMPEGMATGRRAAVRGMAVLKERPDIISKGDYEPMLQRALGDALRGLAPRVQAQMLGGVKAILADTLSRGGTLDRDAVEAAVQQGIGEVSSINGGNVILPLGVTENDLHRVINGLTDAEVMAHALGGVKPVDDQGHPVPPSSLSGYRPMTVGADAFGFTDRNGNPLYAADGSLFRVILDGKAVSSILTSRRKK